MSQTQHQIAGVTVALHEAPADGTYLITINGRYITKATFSRDDGPKRWTCGCGHQARNRDTLLSHVVRQHGPAESRA